MVVHNKGPDAKPQDCCRAQKNEDKYLAICGRTGGGSTKDKIVFRHPAIFPEKLDEDHILSWSDEGDFVLDPMCGSGTTCKMAALNSRQWIGILEEYIAKERMDLFGR